MASVVSTTSAEPGRAPGGREFARPCERSRVVAGAPLVGSGIQCRRRVEEDPVRDETATRIPHGGADHRARPRHALHLGNRLRGLRHEVQHQQREDAVEGAVGQREGVHVAGLEAHTGVAVQVAGVGDIRGREVDSQHAPGARALRHGEGQAAGAAADIEHVLAVRGADEVEKRADEPPAPAAHDPLVAFAVAGGVGGRRVHRVGSAEG